MDTKQAYNQWAAQYDTNQNKTRDLEAQALIATLAHLSFEHCLEMGCGTGKNTVWLSSKARNILAVDFSEEMLTRARAKIISDRVRFQQADITTSWPFGHQTYDLVSFSLVLEHLEDLNPVFKEVAAALMPGGYVYIGELHPFKQYTGSQARFDTHNGQQVVPCYTHHVSDFIQTAKQNGLALIDMNEYFDDDDRKTIPRILTILLKKS